MLLLIPIVLACGCRSEKQMPIEKVKEAHEKELMAIRGVVGVGIGNYDGKKCIVVHLKDYSSEIEKIPTEIEGYPVRWDVIREIKAL